MFNFHRTIVAVLLVLSSGLLSAIEPAVAAPEDLLFLAHFNHSLAPDFGNFQGMINHAELTAGNKGYPFHDSVPSPEALNVNRGRRYLVFPAKDNFDVQQGTLQFLLLPQWAPDTYGHCVFFKVIFSGDTREQMRTATENSFVLQKPPRRSELAFSHAGHSITHAIPYNPNAWLQITVTWDQKASQRAFYINGEKVGEGKFLTASKEAVEFILGAPLSWNAQAYIDEVRILRRPLTDAEVAQDAKALLAGQEFLLPEQPSPTMPTLTPRQATGEVSGFAAKLSDSNFPVPKSNQEATIDGVLDEEVWKICQPITELVSRRGAPAEAKTTYRLFFTDLAMFLAAELEEPDMDNLAALYDQRDQSVYNDDCIEFLLDVDGESERFYHFAVNALGTLFDARLGDTNWNGNDIKTSATRHKDKWQVEMRIPFAAFGLRAPLPGEYWGARFCRERRAGKREVTSIPQVLEGGYNQRAYLGKLIFSANVDTGDFTLRNQTGGFLLGSNSLSLLLDNRGANERNLWLQAIQFDSDNNRLQEQEISVQLPAKSTSSHNFQVSICDDTCERVVLLLTDEQNTILASDTLRRGFLYQPPGLKAQLAHLRQLEQSLGSRSTVRHPVFQGAREAIQQLQEKLLTFQQELETALVEKRTVAANSYSEVSSWINGFQDFQEKYRYLAWAIDPWDYGSPETLPPLNYSFDDLRLNFKQAGNEREVLAFALSGLLGGARLDLRVVPSSYDERGKTFVSCDQFEVFIEPYMDHNGVTITAPLIQAPGNIITLTPGYAQRVWVVFNSRGVPAGDYQTTIELKPAYQYDIPTRSIPVTMKVWNFTLPETHEWPLDCFFWTGQFTPLDETALLRLMHDYHINWTMTESIHYLRGFERDRRKRLPPPPEKLYDAELTRTANQDFFEEAKRLKMKFIFAWGAGPDLEWHQIMSERLEKMGFTMKDYIFKNGIRDEFKKADIPLRQEFRDTILAASPGWTFQAVYLSLPPPSGATLADLEAARLTDFYKNWTIISGRLTDPKTGPETIAYFRERGCTVWPYRCNRNMQTLPILEYYRFFPWFAYQNDLPGIAYWTAYSSKGDDGFDHRDGYDDGITWRGIKKSPIPTKRLQAVREGLEDVAYMHILKNALQNAEQKQLLSSSTLAEYTSLLTEVPAQIMTDNSQSAVDQWRLAVGEAIHALNADGD